MFRLDQLILASTDLQVRHGATPISVRDWEESVGTRIAQRAEPVRLERGVLTVRTATAVWAHELSLLADGILEQLRARNIAVDKLRFVVGKVASDGRARLPVRHGPPPLAKVPALLAPAVAAIADPELRAAVEAACAKTIALTEPPAQAPAASSRRTRATKRG